MAASPAQQTAPPPAPSTVAQPTPAIAAPEQAAPPATPAEQLPATPTPPVAAPATLPLPTPADQKDDVVVRARDTRGDPMASINATVLQVTESVDKAFIGPVAMTYKKVPTPLRSGLRNFLVNLREPIVFANFLLQLKFGKAAETAARFGINSTIGVAGVFDMAKRKPFHLPLRRNGFADTLGFWGVKPGPFFFLPLIGPTTLRDLFGSLVDQVIIPLQPIRPSGSIYYVAPVGILSALDYRVRIDPDLQRQRATADPYAALREDYLTRRRVEIGRLRGEIKDVPLPKANDSPYSFPKPEPTPKPPKLEPTPVR